MDDVLPTDTEMRKRIPMARGLLDYFPLALAYVAEVSAVATEQHHPGEPIHWDREKSTDHADCIIRHLIDRGNVDVDGMLHSGKVAWRALALLQIELEEARSTRADAMIEEVRSIQPTPAILRGAEMLRNLAAQRGDLTDCQSEWRRGGVRLSGRTGDDI